MNNEDLPDGGNTMTYKMFKNGYFFSMWDLTTGKIDPNLHI